MARKIRIRWNHWSAMSAARVTRRGMIMVLMTEHPDDRSVKAIALASVHGVDVLQSHVHMDLGSFPTSGEAAIGAVKFLESPAALELLEGAVCECHREPEYEEAR